MCRAHQWKHEWTKHATLMQTVSGQCLSDSFTCVWVEREMIPLASSTYRYLSIPILLLKLREHDNVSYPIVSYRMISCRQPHLHRREWQVWNYDNQLSLLVRFLDGVYSFLNENSFPRADSRTWSDTNVFFHQRKAESVFSNKSTIPCWSKTRV